MVRTRPTNRLGRIPHGTKIDLTGPSKKLPVRCKVTMEDSASTAKSPDKLDSPTDTEIDLFLGLTVGVGEASTPLGDEHEEQEEDQTPCSEKDVAEPVKEKTSSSKVAKKKPPSAKGGEKTKADLSATASSPTEETEEASGKDEETEVQSGESNEVGEEETEEAEEETREEEDESDDDEPPTKRTKKPSQSEEEVVTTVAPEGIAEKGIVAPKKLDFTALRKLGVQKEVRRNFANIGWEKFLDLDSTVYAELVKEFFAELRSKAGQAKEC